MFRVIFFVLRRLLMLKFLFVIIEFFCFSKFSILLYFVIFLFEILFENRYDIKEMVLYGVILIKFFSVVLFLYEEQNCDWSSSEVGVCIKIFVQFNIIFVFGYMVLKFLGMNLFILLCDGQIIWFLRKKYRKLYYVVIFLFIEDI